MANDFYLNEETAEDWSLLEQEFHEWQVLKDVVDLVKTNGLQSVLSLIINMLEDKERV